MEYTNEELAALIQQGRHEYMDDLCRQNERFVRLRALRFVPADGSNHRRDLDDLMQCGFLGLMKAVEKFDLIWGTTFLTYASHWIDQAIRRGLTNGRHHSDPIDSAGSLDMPLRETEEGCLLDMMPDKEALAPEEEALRADIQTIVRERVARLPEDPRDAVQLCHFQGLTLQQAADLRGVCYQRMHQRKEDAFRRLRRDRILRQLEAEHLAYRHKSLTAFRSDWTSTVEEAVLRIERRAAEKS